MERESNPASNNACLYKEYLPDPSTVPVELKECFQQLSASDNRQALKQTLKLMRKIMLSPNEYPRETQLIKEHLQPSLLAETILGTTGGEMRFQALQLINMLGGVNTSHLLRVVPRIIGSDHLRNLSELMDVLTTEQLLLADLQQYFVVPLLEAFRKAVECILAETFSVKWLDSFIELARSLNNLLKKKEVVPAEAKQRLIELCRQALQHISVLRRDIITQLYLILLTLSPEEPEPEIVLGKVHYLHAKSVVYGMHILPRLLQYTTLVETQTKYHLLYGLSYSLEKEFVDYPNKSEVFDRIVELFEVGRTAYNLLDQMIRFIIKNHGEWKLDGYVNRKFFFARCIMKALDDCQQVMVAWPTILSEGISYSGDLNTPFAIDCVEIILQLEFRRCQEDPEVWLKLWIGDYLKYLVEGQRLTVKGIVEYINPIVCRVSKRPVLLRHLLELDALQNHTQENISLGIISLLQCYREGGMVEPRQNGLYEYKEHPRINVSQSKLEPLLQSNNTSIALKAFEFVTVSQKPSEVVLPFEYELCLTFYRYGLITSNTDYRRNYITATRKFFERLRTVYERELLPQPNKKAKPVKMFAEFKRFLQRLLADCFQRLYPQMPFELANPSLEIIQLALNFFGAYDYEVRKGTVTKANGLLSDLGVFTRENFAVVASCLQSSFENVRTLAYNNLKLFPLDFKLDCSALWDECLQLTNSLVIRQFESGCRLLCFLFERYRDQTPVPRDQHTLPELALYEYLLKLMNNRYQIFSRDFTNQTPSYYRNLVHGLCMCFAFLFEQLAKDIKQQPMKYNPHADSVRNFISRLFALLQKIISFAVEVSCANVSTVVLDSSQPKTNVGEKLKVDCRGHFIQQDKKQCLSNIDTMLSGATLMTSVEEEEGSIENTLVVSFYLLTRESGLLFQSIAALAEADGGQRFLSEKALTDVIYSFFYALVNLKHMGSVDRIARGLQRMSKALYRQENPALSTLPENLLKRLLELLEESKFTNILRRSAGIPYAFTCLLKSEALRRRHLVDSTLSKLFHFARNDQASVKQLRIHSLNILKRLFQDSDLRFELDPFVSEAFVLSIKGFGTEDWGVRNSSLMLFSSLSLRTLGPKPELNLMQFFQKCPSLVDYFMEELNNYIKVKTMYPPLYPIALILSRLSPFDHVDLKVRDTHEENSKLLRREDLNKFIPLLVEAGNTPNYMGRVIIGKALLPFLQSSNILEFCSELLTKADPKGGMNKLHNELLIVYHLLSSLHDLESNSEKKQVVSQLAEKQLSFFKTLTDKLEWIERLQCPLVQEVIVKISHKFLERWSNLLQLQNSELYAAFVKRFQQFAEGYLRQNVFELKKFRFRQDLGHSVLRIEVIKLALALSNRLTFNQKMLKQFEDFLRYVADQSAAATDYWSSIDTEVVTTYLGQLLEVLRDKTVKQDYANLTLLLTRIAFQNQRLNQGVLAKVLQLLRRLKAVLTPEQINYLLSKFATTHQPLKIALFKILIRQKCDLLALTEQFSRPDQLTVFREAAAKSITTFNERLIPTYIRLLQDEDSEIRKFTADQLSIVLGLPKLNETKLAEMMMQRLPSDLVATVFADGDLEVKGRNNEETRIFSFDKPNKFRSDVGNVLTLVLTKQPVDAMQHGFLLKSENEEFIATYQRRVFFRNEYKFEWMLRRLAHLILVEKKPQQAKREVEGLQPMLQKLVAQLTIIQ